MPQGIVEKLAGDSAEKVFGRYGTSAKPRDSFRVTGCLSTDLSGPTVRSCIALDAMRAQSQSRRSSMQLKPSPPNGGCMGVTGPVQFALGVCAFKRNRADPQIR